MAKKLKCSITGDWSYCSDDRMQKLVATLGSVEAAENGYISRKGKTLLAAADGDVGKAQKAAAKETIKNKIACTVSGELMFISDQRMKHLMEKGKTDEDGVRAGYVSRVAQRLRKEAAAGLGDKPFAELSQKAQREINRELKDRFTAGNWPAPSAPKGSKQEAPAPEPAPVDATAEAPAKKARKRNRKKVVPSEPTEVLDTTPTEEPAPVETIAEVG